MSERHKDGTTKLKIPVDISEYVKYDTSSPTYLTWVVKRGNAGCKAGAPVGSLKNTGAFDFTFKGVKYLNHRVIWFLFYGDLDSDKFIDHIDGCPTNNSIENLRLVYREFNARNCKMLINNRSGVTGVKLTDAGKGYTYWTAFWRDTNKKEVIKHFSIKKLGFDTAKEKAIACRVEAIKAMDNGYTERHGL